MQQKLLIKNGPIFIKYISRIIKTSEDYEMLYTIIIMACYAVDGSLVLLVHSLPFF